MTTSMRLNVTVLFAVGLVAACQASTQLTSGEGVAVDTAAIKASIDSLAAVVMRAHETGDAELFASTWAEDGMMSAPGSAPIRGVDSIVADFRRRPPLPSGATMAIYPTEMKVMSAEWVYVLGTDTLTSTPEGAGTPIKEAFTFLVIIRKTANGWRSYREVLSANQPPSGPQH